jgi:hypothetical protein
LAFRTGVAVAAVASGGAWIGCNELFGISAPVLDTADGGADASPAENCLNGVDDNGNGLVDCADPQCQVGYGCAVDPETGWTGLFYVQAVTYPASSAPATCPDGKLPAIYYASPSTADCTGCSCTLSGAACTAPQVSLYNVGGCQQTAVLESISATTTACQFISTPNSSSSLQVTALPKVTSAGTCAADGGALVSPEPWGQEVRLCAAPAGKGCHAGQSCVKDPPSGFQGEACITQVGTGACPSGWTDQSLQLYAGGTDGRACSPCTCDTSTVSCTGGKYTANASNDCAVAPGTTPLSIGAADGCVNTGALAAQNHGVISLEPELSTPGGPTCGTSSPIGTFTLTGSLRLCCRQIFQ